MKEYLVKDLVIDDEYDTIDADAKVIDAAKKMKKLGIPDLVVVEKGSNKVLGVVADFDIVENSTSISAAKGNNARSIRGLKKSSNNKANKSRNIRKYLNEKDRFITNDIFRRSGAVVFSSSRGGEFSYENNELLMDHYIFKGK